MKLCKDCHWHKSHDYYKNGTSYYDECLCPDVPKYKNPVTGEEIINRCFSVRLDEKTCGKDGKYWTERKPPETKPPETKEQFWSRMFNFG